MVVQPHDEIKILIVDDKPEGLVALEAVLNFPNYKLIKASSGHEALKCLLNEDFALILMDVQMPNLDGFETASIIKTRERSKNIPIIFITAINKDDRYVHHGYESGAVDYIFKPFHPNTLRSKVAIFADIYRKTLEIKYQAETLRRSERLLREQELFKLELENLQRYRSLADAIPNMVWRAHSNGTLDYFNQHWCDYTGLTLDQSNGIGWQSMIESEDLIHLLTSWSHAMKSGKSFEIECRIKRKSDGVYRWHLVRILPERNKYSQLVAWLGTATDIDDQKHIQVELRELISIRDEFLSVAAHELKTPLTSFKFHVQSLQKKVKSREMSVTPEKLEKILNILNSQADRLTTLINTLLDNTSIRAGKLSFDFEETDLSRLTREVLDRLSVQLDAAKCSVHLEAEEPLMVFCDRCRMDQVIVNLVSNAIKYAPNKPIHVSVIRIGGKVKVKVQDFGPGISKIDQIRIFKQFERATTLTNTTGLGLGLYIVSQIVEGHHGEIRVESELGNGSSFIVEIPVQRTNG